ncbi:hypothetical protein V6L77_16110 [Pannonibacter sp. Pt2-lr]
MSEMMTPETPAKAAPKARATKTTKPATAASPLLNSRLCHAQDRSSRHGP